MDVKEFLNIIGSEFYTGVPDSLLRPVCDYLIDTYGTSGKHIIAANEGNAVAIAAGYYMATGKAAVVYMQNSGIGNTINPVASLLSSDVYAIPCIFIVGWRGEPGIKDEPQHLYQGKVTDRLLEDMDIAAYHLKKDTSYDELCMQMSAFRTLLEKGKSVAFIVSKGALSYENKTEYHNNSTITRESVIKLVTEASDEDVIVSTTGKASRELFEIREHNGQGHQKDFLTVGSMGHSSSIALGIAVNRPERKVWCIDGDGAVIMHMGSMAVIGNVCPQNFVHIVINNSAHESVGGMPTAASTMNLCQIAMGCGYKEAYTAETEKELRNCLMEAAKSNQLTLIEVKTAIGSRKDLGRPTTTPKENLKEFMENMKNQICGHGSR